MTETPDTLELLEHSQHPKSLKPSDQTTKKVDTPYWNVHLSFLFIQTLTYASIFLLRKMWVSKPTTMSERLPQVYQF